MEPLDPTKNSEGSGFSKRRLSSILKAPRKSSRFTGPEQQENVVECVKPVEKRNSRRVSFAPANDVLLFSKDVKNTSPARSPLQELIRATGAATTQNWFQVEVIEDGSRQITGMETLLKAPLHASQQRDKVNFDTVNDFGEKTVMFFTEDAVMDMTHSHTINIGAELSEDIPLQDYDILPTVGEKRMIDDKSMILSHAANKTSGSKSLSTDRNEGASASVPCLDPMFENFLASLSKPSGQSTDARMTPFAGPPFEKASNSFAQIQIQRPDVDKENHALVSGSALKKTSINNTRKTGEPSRRALCPRDGVSMDVMEAQTGCTLGGCKDGDDDDDDDPFQYLLPAQNLHSRSDIGALQVKLQQSSKTSGLINPADKESLVNPLVHSSDHSYKVSSDAKDECGEETIMFTEHGEFMDMTGCHTVNIASGPLAPVQTSADGKENQPLNTIRSFGKSFNGATNCPDDGVRMEMTTQTRCSMGLPVSDDPFQFLIPSQDTYVHCEILKKADTTSGQCISEPDLPDLRGTETSCLKGKKQNKPDPEDEHSEKTVRFSLDDACMDVTRSHTVNISQLELQSHQNLDFLLDKENTLELTANDAIVDEKKGIAVNTGSNLVSDSGQPVKKHKSETHGMPTWSAHSLNPGFGDVLTVSSKRSDSTINPVITNAMCPEGDMSMDMTEAQTAHILEGNACTDTAEAQTGLVLFPTQGICPRSSHVKKAERTSHWQSSETTGSSSFKDIETFLKTSVKTMVQRHQVKLDVEDDCREKTVRFTADDAHMDVTRSHTVNIATELNIQSDQNADLSSPNAEKTVRFSADDAAMDVTKSHTVNIATELNIQSHQNADLLPSDAEKTVRFTANDAAMDVTRSHTVNIATELNIQSHQNADLLSPNAEKTVRFSADDAAMDVTKSHTVNIATELNTQSHQNADLLSPNAEKTVRFSADDAHMDVTRSHTVNIATELNIQSHQNADLLSPNAEKTVRFSADDAAMDVTECHTVNIATELNIQSHQNADLLSPNAEKTVRFSADDAAMDVTKCHTVNISTDMEIKSHQIDDFLPISGEKTVRFTTEDAAMEMTECLTVNIPCSSASASVVTSPKVLPIQEDHNFSFALETARATCGLLRNRSSSAHDLDQEFKNVAKTSDPLADIKPEGSDTPYPQKNTKSEAPDLVSAVIEKPVNKTMTNCPEINTSMDMAEAQTGLNQPCTDESPQSPSLTQGPNSDHLRQTGMTSQRSDDLVLSSPDVLEITNVPDSPKANKRENRKEHDPRTTTCPLSQESSPSDQDVGVSHSRKSRRMSLADLQSKVRRLSHMINTAPNAIVMDSQTAPLPQVEEDLNKNSTDKITSQPVAEPELEMGMVNTEDNAQAQCRTEAEHPSAASATPSFSSKTKQLMSRISMGGFKPKLPQRSKSDDSKKKKSAGEHTSTVTVNVASQLSDIDNDVSDIYDEELGSYEDMSETLDMRSPQKISNKENPSPELNMAEPLEDSVFEEDFINPVHGQKRPLPEDENDTEDQKKMKASSETAEMALHSDVVECDSNMTIARMTTQSIDCFSNSQTSRIISETASESTFKQSLFESQLEVSASDVQKNLEDGSITVLEFFKLFGIDFVIHNPRQSVLPGRVLSDTDATPMDLLRDRHISRPKQMVYETDVLNLTEKVEGLKVRMRDLDKPLKTVNKALWEEMRYASEKELKSFGAKLKERNNFFRKTSKVQSHEMKEILYSNLVQANLDEQQKLRGKIQEADEMIKTLDDCIHELETELAAVEEKGFEDKPSLKSLQEEMKKVTETMTDNERQISELELQKKQNSSKLKRLQAETRNLESHVGILNMVNEWKLREMRDDCKIYTFLHETMHLQLVYEKLDGNVADSEQKITHIAFKHELDDEKSECHARLVHKLVSQYTEGESSWVEKYPTSIHVPKLLHDVSLVVSHCRLLGEELRLLKLWGGLRLDILNISCMDTKVHIVFSSLKKFSKFEVVFSISLINHLYALQVESFKNIIGNTTIQKIEEIVSSFTPSKKLLTKTVKKIHEMLLC